MMRKSIPILLLFFYSLFANPLLGQPIRLGGELVELSANVEKRSRSGSAQNLELGAPVDGKQVALVQFKALPTQAQRSKLGSLGVKLQSYVGSNAYYATVPAGVQPTALRGTGLKAIAPIKGSWRLAPALREGRIPKYAQREGNRAARFCSQPLGKAQFYCIFSYRQLKLTAIG